MISVIGATPGSSFSLPPNLGVFAPAGRTDTEGTVLIRVFRGRIREAHVVVAVGDPTMSLEGYSVGEQWHRRVLVAAEEHGPGDG